MTITIAEAILSASDILRRAGVPEARREAGSLLSFVTSRDRTFVISHADDLLVDEQVQQLREAVERRAKGEPLQYITGSQDFYGRDFKVSPDVLIPRPETELLVAEALRLVLDSVSTPLICDVGTGSGCIAVTVLCERPEVNAFALDISASALEVAKENAAKHGVAERIVFKLSDCFSALTPDDHQFDVVLSNPPYVAADVVAGLQREVRDHEPAVALSPGADGLAVIRRLIQESPAFLKRDGYLLMEIGFDQGESVRRLVDPSDWELRDVLPDLQGIPRIVVLQKKE